MPTRRAALRRVRCPNFHDLCPAITGHRCQRQLELVPSFRQDGGPARAAPRDELVLGHLHCHRRQIEHLPALLAHLGRLGQIGAAPGAGARLVPQPLVRVGHQRQRRPRMPRLPAGFAAALAAQRLRYGLAERRIRRRRLRRVPAVQTQLPSQLRVLGPQRSDIGTQLVEHSPQCRVLRRQLLIRRARTGGHPAMIRHRRRRSTRHAIKPQQHHKSHESHGPRRYLTSYRSHCVTRRSIRPCFGLRYCEPIA